jgi:SpoVK/Ycf46/Vps4 family AAA+-type ATPase
MNTLQSEMQAIQQELLVPMQQLRAIFDHSLDIDSSESPPADPPASPQSIFTTTNAHQAQRKTAGNVKLASQSFKQSTKTLVTNPSKSTRTRNGGKAVAKDKSNTLAQSSGAVLIRNGVKIKTEIPSPDDTQTSGSTMESSGFYLRMLLKNKLLLLVCPDSTIERPPFEFAGYDKELVELIQNDILQQTAQVKWKDISGLEEAKMLLFEAVVLPMEHPVK